MLYNKKNPLLFWGGFFYWCFTEKQHPNYLLNTINIDYAITNQ